MNFDGFLGNHAVKSVLNTHPFHAYLIEGPEGSGRHTLADRITQALLCDGENPPCGKCRQCYKFREKCHPDVLELSADLRVEDLRRELAGIYLAPNDAGHKIYRIDRADRMLPQAQNLLLKSLEEPPKDVVFLLICSSREGILPTVRSRCQTLTLAPLTEDDMEKLFVSKYGKYDEKARNAVALSAGFPGKAIALYENGEGQRMETCRALDDALRKNDPAAVFGIFRFSDREALNDFFDAFSLYLRRCLREKNGIGSDTRYYAELCRVWDGAAEDVKTNINVKLWNTNLARLCLNAGLRSDPHRK